MGNNEEVDRLVALNHRLLVEERTTIGYLCTIHTSVKYSNPEAEKTIREQLGRVNGFLALVYIWALMDENGLDEKSRWIDPGRRRELKAWKHIRHTGAHAPSGRADGYREEFDALMADPDKDQSGLARNCKVTPDGKIKLHPHAVFRFYEYLGPLVQTAIVRCSQDEPYESK